MKFDISKKLYNKGLKALVGSVNSPVRAFGSVGGDPLFIKKGEGAYIIDADDNSYVDLVGSYGPLILGHAYPSVKEKVIKAVEKGFSFGASTESEIELAEMVVDAFPSMDKIRFVNSGTEAIMSAIRLARAYTGKNKIIKFAGCYHGHADPLLAASGSGVATLSIPGSKGVPESSVQDTLIAKFNDAESVRKFFNEFKDEIAAVFLEPVAGNMGVVKPENDFLKELKKITEENDALLVIDEVMTGFRAKFGGAQDIYEVKADITCLGKVIGGGFPVGAFGGRKEIMNRLAPVGDVYQAGTLSGNPVAMAAGIATLEELQSLNPYEQFEKQTAELEECMHNAAKENHLKISVNKFGSMINPFFTDQHVSNFSHAQTCDTKMFSRFFWGLIENGVYIPPSQFESWFLPAILSQKEIDITKAAIQNAMKKAVHT